MDGLFILRPQKTTHRLGRANQHSFFAFALASITALITAATPSVQAAAMDDDSDYVSYDSIIRQLQNQQNQSDGYGSSSRTRYRGPSYEPHPLDLVMIHAGVGYSSLIETISFPEGQRLYLNQKGFQAALGIDLFSENWMAEGTARSFADSEDNTTKSQLKEFDLKVIYKKRLAGGLGIRGGAGLSGRYMTIWRPDAQLDYTTPSSLASLGMDLFVNESLSFGLDISGRQALIGETLDRNSVDATLRLDTHF